MFGLSQLYERLILLGVIAVMAVSGFFYIEHLGAQKCVKDYEAASAVETRKENVQHGKDVTTTQNEGQTFEAAKTAPVAPAPVVSLCSPLHRPAKQAPATPTSSPDAKAPGGATPEELPPVRWDTEPIVRIGHEADAQIAGLQDYITNVCRPK